MDDRSVLEPEIEITPEMIEAGTLEFASCGDYETPQYWVGRIIKAALESGGYAVTGAQL